MKDKRKYCRLPLEINGSLAFEDGTAFQGMTKNISFGGLFFMPSELLRMEVDQLCEITLQLGRDLKSEKIVVSGRIVYQTVDGVGVEFQRIAIDSYVHLKRLLVFNSEDSDSLLKEIRANPGILPEDPGL
ncbi:MAG: PilZ domain-containing protein [Desulfobulbaceae bacterium]|nr:PilZ domain-containing protein [Desulfobulbaceae bacterium]MCK5339821.1 PilZ domain-containing protein [Desulfobulbaceae bacterium]MCK5405349.1 PilZ domain-containing protein [Desulfobulbaceae bacterium]